MPRKDDLASRLRHRIAVESPLYADDGGGGAVMSWEKFADAWAELTPQKPSETLLGEQVVGVVTYSLTMRYLPGVLYSMRIKFSGRYFNIKAVWNEKELGKMTKMIIQEDIFQ